MNTIIITSEVFKQMVQQALKEQPLEACGYLAGTGNKITKLFRMTNKDRSAEHFSFVPEEQFAVVKQAREQGLRLIGIYHSHPASPARLSEEDIRLAYDRSILYVIVSLHKVEPKIKAFRFDEDMVEEIYVAIKDGMS